MKIIEKEGNILAKYIKADEWNEGLNFFSNDADFIQVGAWKYQKGKDLLNHVHNEVKREVTRTCECLYIISGSVQVRIYDLEKNLMDEFTAAAGDIVILLECGHGYTILEDNTKVLEVKNGPYMGADIDRTRF